MRTLDLSAWSQQQLMYLLIATFLAIILLIVALLIYLRRTRPQPTRTDKGEMAPPPEIVLRRRGWAGRMEVIIGGRTYRRMKDVDDAATRRALMLAAGDLVAFVEPTATQAPPPKTSPPTAAAEAPSTGKYYAPARELAQQAFLAQLEAANLAAPPSGGWLAVLGRGLGSRTTGGAAGSFVEDIEQIIQRRCKEQSIDMSVHLRTDGQGIVRVEVDGVLYDSPADIPDIAIRELIRAAVGEWEARF
ncbi:MAG: hypothetical protein H5T65_01920 [Chloroflexi bacterium]|nr:hypothetical protein [Chloroflexota bacterium]